MTTNTRPQEPVAVPQLHPGDTIHLAPHEVYRHSDHPFPITCEDADVEVDWVCYREHVVVIVIWHIPVRDDNRACPAVCGSTAYDADDRVLRLAMAS